MIKYFCLTYKENSNKFLPLHVRVDLGVREIKGYSVFPQTPGLEADYEMVYCHISDTYPSAEIQSTYSTAPMERAVDNNACYISITLVNTLWGHLLGSIPGRIIPKTLKMVLDTSLLNIQQYKVLSSVKWSKPGKRVTSSRHLGVVAIEKGAFGSPSTTAANFTCFTYLLTRWKDDYFKIWTNEIRRVVTKK